MQETLDQVNVREDHAAAAVALELKLCQRLAFCAALDEQGEVCIPLVADDLAATKAANWDDHTVWKNVRRTGDEKSDRKNRKYAYIFPCGHHAVCWHEALIRRCLPPWHDNEWVYV